MKIWIPVTIIMTMSLFLAGCFSSASLPPNPQPSPTPFTITVDGKVILLIPGENILPEIYEAAKSPEMLENNDWVFVDGYWDLMPKGVSGPLEVEEPVQNSPAVPLYPGFPQEWRTYVMSDPPLEVDHPVDWDLKILKKGMLMTAPGGSTWIGLETFPNPAQASLQVWLAEFGPGLPAEVLETSDVFILGEPALFQRVALPEKGGDPAGEYLSLWMGSGATVYHWTAWPGEQPETYDLLMYVAATLNK
jgi:hypothetical protein